MKAFKQLMVVEFKMFWREPVAVFSTFAFPFVLLLLFGTLFGRAPAVAATPGFRVIDLYVPAVLSTIIAYLGLIGTPIAIAEYREQGVLRQYRASPLAPALIFFAHLAVQVVLLVAVSICVVLVAHLVFGIRDVYLGYLPSLGLAFLIGVFTVFAIGFALFAMTSSPRSTQAIGILVFLVMLFTSGAAIPRSQFPEWLVRVTDFVPLTHVVETVSRLWTGEQLSWQWPSFLYLVGWGMVALAVAARTFRWGR